MSKAKLEFDLTDFDDRVEFERATRSTDMAMVLWEMVYNTKKKLYYKFEDMEEKDEKPTVYDGVDSFLELLIEELNEKGIVIDKLIV
jgi:hypothetical protein